MVILTSEKYYAQDLIFNPSWFEKKIIIQVTYTYVQRKALRTSDLKRMTVYLLNLSGML